MLVIAEGKPGSGKSYVMVQRLCAQLARGCIVHTNIRVVHDAICAFVFEYYGARIEPSALVFWEKGSELWANLSTACPRGTREHPNQIYLDEAHKFCNSRDWKATHAQYRDNLVFATEHRHFHIDLTFITQDALNLDAQFRRLAQFYFRYRDLSRVSLPFAGRIYPFPHTMEIIIDYDGKTKMGQNIIVRKKSAFELYYSEAAQFEEKFAPLQARATVVVDKRRRLVAQLERAGFWVAIIGVLICVCCLLA